MRTPKKCVAVNTGCSARDDDRICLPVTFAAGNNLRNVILRLQCLCGGRRQNKLCSNYRYCSNRICALRPLLCFKRFVHHHHHHHHRISVTQLGHLLTPSGLTYPEFSSKVYYDSFCQSDCSVSLSWVIYFEAFYLHVVSIFPRIPVICPKLVLFLTPLQFVYFFCNVSKCILLFFSCFTCSDA